MTVTTDAGDTLELLAPELLTPDPPAPEPLVSEPPTSQGGRANLSGLGLEDRIEATLADTGFEIIPYADWDEARLYESEHPRLVVLDPPYTSIYGHRARIEFRVIDGARQILIEAKRQNVPGSTDEKLPYVFQNALANISDDVAFVLVMEGDGWKPGAVVWIRAQADATEGFDVFTFGEFQDWAARELAAVPATLETVPLEAAPLEATPLEAGASAP